MMLPKIDRHSVDGDVNYKAPKSFPIGPHFTRYAKNPIMRPNPDNEFESTYLYNATAMVIDDKVYLLYRAQNKQKVSTVGLAWSDDGYHFTRYHKPIIYPTEPWELGGGCEDPRIVRDPVSKLFIVTYTGYNKDVARLCVAVSEDLFNWTKFPPVIPEPVWLKSGAVFVDKHKDGKYYMIFGDTSFYLAQSDDLQHWKMVNKTLDQSRFTKGVFDWQNRLIEPGAAPIKVEYIDEADASEKNHYILFYNSATNGTEKYERGTYTISQMLIDYDDLSSPLARMDKPMLEPQDPNEVNGQVDQVVFTEGMVQFHGKWFIYFGQSDSELGVATCDAN